MKFSENRRVDFLFGCVFAVGLLAGTASLITCFAQYHWFFDLFTHFRVQMALGLLLAGGVLSFSRLKRTAWIFLVLLVLHLIEIVPFYFSKTPGEGADLKVLLINVNSSTGDPDRVLNYLELTPSDIIVIQEYSLRWVKLQVALQDEYPYQLSEPRGDNFGMALFSKKPFLSQEIFYFTEDELPSLGVEFELNQQKVFFLATHPLPPMGREYTQNRNLQLIEIAHFLADSSGPAVLVGDLNTSPWSPVFKDLLRISGLKNSMQGFGVQPTWPCGISPLWIPLDHLLHSREFMVFDRKTGPNVGSDHFPLEVILGL